MTAQDILRYLQMLGAALQQRSGNGCENTDGHAEHI